ncbi:MAG: hypothetical protein ABGW87_01085 [Sphingomonadaceae bacterium]
MLAAAIQGAGADEPVRIDILVPPPCAAQQQQPTSTSEIVVCARRQDNSQYRLEDTVPQSRNKGLPKAQVQLAKGVSVSAETESEDFGMARSNRAMVRFKIKF